jgi:parvulin-like peptidyl-prolyl isomerase
VAAEGRRMRWHDWLGCGVVVCGVAVSGCVTTEQTLKPSPTVDLTKLDNPEQFGVNIARAQQPAGEGAAQMPAPRLQDVPPPDVANLLINGIPAARIRAAVNTEAITDEEVKAACYPILMDIGNRFREPERSQKQLEAFKATLDRMVEREVILQVAFARLRKNGGEKAIKTLTELAEKEFERQWVRPLMEGNHIKTEVEFKDKLRTMNMSLPMMKRQWTRDFMAQEFVRQSIIAILDKIGHPQIEEYYNQHPEDFQVADSVQWEDVFVAEALHPPREAARQRADAVLARLRAGESMDKLLQDKVDDGDSSQRDGRGLGSKRGEIRPADVEGPLFQLNAGEATIVEIGSGYHVVRVVKREKAGMRPFDNPEVQKQVRDKLRNEIGQREMKELIRGLRKLAVVDYFTN